MSLLSRLLRFFYRTGLPCLPVVEPGHEAHRVGPLIGFLSRAELDRMMVDLERVSSDLDRIPDRLLVQLAPGDPASTQLRKAARIPVLDRTGEQVASWDEADLLRAMAERPRPEAAVAPGATPDPSASSKAGPETTGAGRGRQKAAMAEMLLGSVPLPLFAQDLEAKTIFYNRAFERDVLRRAALKNSIRLAEALVTEIGRNLLARSFEEDPTRRRPHSVLSTYHAELGLSVQMSNLERDGRIQGYLFVFQDPGGAGQQAAFTERIVAGEGLEDVVDSIEAGIIYQMLERNGQNVTHAAKALKIKRSTLQNKMKRLRIDERFQRMVDGPIRRQRRASASAVSRPASKKKAASGNQTIRRKAAKKKASARPVAPRARKASSGAKATSKKKKKTARPARRAR